MSSETNSNAAHVYAGRCTCGDVRYRMTARPLFVHCCHCRWCQRESGGAFALNAMIEMAHLEVSAGRTIEVLTPSLSGRGQKMHRCPRCHVALWSHYGGAGDRIAFVRVGSLEEPDRLPPEIHIFTSSKQPWVQIPAGVPTVPEFYDRKVMWPAASLASWRDHVAALKA